MLRLFVRLFCFGLLLLRGLLRLLRGLLRLLRGLLVLHGLLLLVLHGLLLGRRLLLLLLLLLDDRRRLVVVVVIATADQRQTRGADAGAGTRPQQRPAGTFDPA